MSKNNEMIGSIRYEHGTFYIKPDYGSCDGLNQGRFFKDELAYKNNWNAPCYVPERYFDDEDEVSDSFFTHRSLLEECGYNKELCDAMFSALSWQSPEVWLEELESEDYANFWSWLKVGCEAYWGLNEWWNAGFYEVIRIEDDPENWNPDTIVWLRKEDDDNPGEYDEIEARLCDLAETDVQETIY